MPSCMTSARVGLISQLYAIRSRDGTTLTLLLHQELHQLAHVADALLTEHWAAGARFGSWGCFWFLVELEALAEFGALAVAANWRHIVAAQVWIT